MTYSWKEDIFRQKNLWTIYLLSRKAFPRPIANRIISMSMAFLIFVLLAGAVAITPEHYNLEMARGFLHSLGSLSFSLALGILGFLIAGFAIFASITKVEIFSELAQTPYANYKEINNLQYVFFNFISVFVIYIGLLSVSMFMILATLEFSPLFQLIKLIGSKNEKFDVAALSIFIFILGQWTVISILRLKSFVWNLYQTVLLAIALEDEISNGARREDR